MFRLAYILLAINLCLFIVYLPFFLVVITTAIDSRNSLFFLSSMFFFIPSSYTVITWIDRWRHEDGMEPMKTFFYLYKLRWKESLQLGGISGGVIILSLADSIFMLQFPLGKWLIPFFFLLFLIAISIMINNFYFRVKNPTVSKREIYKASFYFTVKKWYVGLLNIFLFCLIPIVMLLKPQFGFLITPIFLYGLIYLNCTQIYRGKISGKNEEKD